jgi:hypothetical protein
MITMIFKWGTMSEGTSEPFAAKKRKLGQRFRLEYCIEFSCLIKSTREHYAYCKYCKQDLLLGIEQEMDRSFSTIDSPENPKSFK